ncbi:efflux transporter outer membrane subunit [Pseudoduganella sp. UC29_106]|uniref:efflux transporter outer membrane subunit n=1 Tax=Pseudoduganella sp. UC29_106 TaxID=3374553 RepID=UPI0037570F85
MKHSYTLVIALALAGCAQMKEAPDRQALIAPERIGLAGDIPVNGEGWPAPQWWQRYRDPQLNALVDQALRDAPSLAVAEARLHLGDSGAQLADANRGPAVALAADAERLQLSENGFSSLFTRLDPTTGGPHGRWYTEGTIGLLGSYTLDVWGRKRAQFTAAVGQRNALRAERDQAALLLVGAVTQTYCRIQTDYATLVLLQRARRLMQDLQQAHQERYARGIAPRQPVETARAQLLTIEQQISAVEDRLLQSREALRAQVGAGPSPLALEARALPTTLGMLPPALDYRLLARRPDLQAWRWSVQASLSEIETARAAFYPSFDIRAFIGFNAIHLGDLFSKSGTQMSLVPGLTLPIFDSGRLNAELAISKSQNEIRIAQYNQAVLTAVAEVAQTALALEGLQRQRKLQDAKVESVRFTSASAHAQLERGLGDRLHDIDPNYSCCASRSSRLPCIAASCWQKLA